MSAPDVARAEELALAIVDATRDDYATSHTGANHAERAALKSSIASLLSLVRDLARRADPMGIEVEGVIVGGSTVPGEQPNVTVEAPAFPPITMGARVRVAWPLPSSPDATDDRSTR